MGRRYTGRVCAVCQRTIQGAALHVDISTTDGKIRGGYLACPEGTPDYRNLGCAQSLRQDHPDAPWYEDDGSVGLMPRKERDGQNTETAGEGPGPHAAHIDQPGDAPRAASDRA